MNTPPRLTAAAGAGFYRYWHVPHPHGSLSIRDARRADLSVIGPAALFVASVVVWVVGRAGGTLLLDRRFSTPLEALPWGTALLVLAGLSGAVLAAVWWLLTTRVRLRVARELRAGGVARIPDLPDETSAPLHAAVAPLGRALRQTPPDHPLAEPAFKLLDTAAVELAATGAGRLPEQERRLRRRCLAMARRLDAGADRDDRAVSA